MTRDTNRRWLLDSRPEGAPTEANFRLEEAEIPRPGKGEMLLKTEYLSLDPYMRGRMSDAESYADPVAVGGLMVGRTVARVIESNDGRYPEGHWVHSGNGWQDFAISDGKGVADLGPDPQHPSRALGILGMPGFTAWAGLTQIGQPQQGETLVVAAASGPVGGTVGQIAKIEGCRAVGIAGGPEKCAHVVENLGFDACIDHRADDFAERLAEAVPDGIDIYFENVGGKVLDAVLPLLNGNARVPVCGIVSQYNLTELPGGPDRMNWLMGQILRRKLTFRGFIITDTFGHLFPDFREAMSAWLEAGRIAFREDVTRGLENAPATFIGMLEGENFGKTIVEV